MADCDCRDCAPPRRLSLEEGLIALILALAAVLLRVLLWALL